MNPLEDRIRKVPLLEPDAVWRRQILASAEKKERQPWTTWLWPSPVAWAALVFIWLAIGTTSQFEARKERMANSANVPSRIHVLPDARELRALLAQRR